MTLTMAMVTIVGAAYSLAVVALPPWSPPLIE
jgi:hypothetical protein